MGPPIEECSRRDLLRAFRAGIAAVNPEKLVIDRLDTWAETAGGAPSVFPPQSEKLLVIGAGKAAAAMASGCEKKLGPDRVRGLVVAPDGLDRRLVAIGVARAQHPIPDPRAVEATERICRLLQEAGSGPILCLLSGGASSLLVSPVPPVSLEDKRRTTQLLLDSGIDIGAMNTVRKHLSRVKGGGLLRMTAQRPLSTLLLSDVVGDDPSIIGSGPTTADPTTFADAVSILDRASIWDLAPMAVRDLLERGRRGEVPETVKPGDPAVLQTSNTVIGSNRTALRAAAAEAKRLGYQAVVHETPLLGETAEAARCWYEEIVHDLRSRPPGRYCFLAGGETVVNVRGSGKGGRNQEFALSLAPLIADSGLAILSAGTDGIDGPTNAAGAFVDGSSLSRAQACGLDATTFLRTNDSYSFFERLGDLLVCGPTGTNVMDLKIAAISTLSDSSWLLQN